MGKYGKKDGSMARDVKEISKLRSNGAFFKKWGESIQ